MVLCYTVSFILIIAGVLFYTGRAVSYIKGYEDMPDEEKRTVNIKPLCKNISVMFFLAAAIFALAGFSESFRSGYFKYAMVGWFVLCCADVAFINKSRRYVNQNVPVEKASAGKKSRRANKSIE